MKLQYLLTAEPGARWFRAYYRQNPSLNIEKAVSSLQQTERLLREQPLAGRRFEDRDEVRERKISGTVFSLLYTVADDTIWIIDIRDQRGFRSAEAINSFNQELRERFRIDEASDDRTRRK